MRTLMPPRQVGPVPDQKGWGNVMYIPAAPYCAKNAAYANDRGKAFLTGESPSDFTRSTTRPHGWRPNRDELSPNGRRQLGLQDW
jgi:hypothetical protein